MDPWSAIMLATMAYNAYDAYDQKQQRPAKVKYGANQLATGKGNPDYIENPNYIKAAMQGGIGGAQLATALTGGSPWENMGDYGDGFETGNEFNVATSNTRRPGPQYPQSKANLRMDPTLSTRYNPEPLGIN